MSVLCEGFDFLPVVGVGDDGADDDGNHVEQEVLAAVDATRITQRVEVLSQAKCFENHFPSSERCAQRRSARMVGPTLD